MTTFCRVRFAPGMQSPPPRRTKAGAFTLIELLIVIAIVALLAAILFPVFARARESARRSVCLSNMKQVGLGMMQYLQDYDETYPRQAGNVWYYSSVTVKDPDTNYFASNGGSTASSPDTVFGGVNFLYAVLPYVKTTAVYTCPSATDIPVAGGCPSGVNSSTLGTCWTATKTNSTSYVINGVVIRSASTVSGAVVQPALRLASLPNPAQVVTLQEFLWKINATTNRPRWDGTSRYQYWHAVGGFGATGIENLSNSHFEGGNLLFSDGHAKWRKYTALKSADFGLRGCTGGDNYSSTSPMDCLAFDQ